MAKVNIHTILKTQEKTYEYSVPAILKEDAKILIYKEKDDQRTTTNYNYKTRELTRENDSLHMHYVFDENKNTVGKILVKELNRSFKLTIKTKKIIRHNNNIEIEFLVEEQPFNYKIEVK